MSARGFSPASSPDTPQRDGPLCEATRLKSRLRHCSRGWFPLPTGSLHRCQRIARAAPQDHRIAYQSTTTTGAYCS